MEERAAQALPAGVEARLACVPDGTDAARVLARRGYLTRFVETELFEAARRPVPLLHVDPDEVAGLTAELAAAEPAGRPSPDDERAATWRVPGPGGHVRHYLAVQAARLLAPDLPEDAGKRAWLYGFFVRSLEERAEEDPGGAG